MIILRDVNQYYGDSRTLWDLTIEVAEGSCTCLMGRNGVGKTTTLKCIMGLLPVRSGTIIFDGDDLCDEPPESRAPRGIGYVPQGRDIFPQLSVEENLKIGFSVCERGAAQSAYERVLDMFPVLGEMLHRLGGDLSGGQQQQLAIGRALILDPRLLILDEPTEGIQPNIVHEIGEVIRRLNREEGITVLLVEQKLPLARRVADRFCILEKGRAVAAGMMGDLDDSLIKTYLTV